jgi:hypothetical protein
MSIAYIVYPLFSRLIFPIIGFHSSFSIQAAFLVISLSLIHPGTIYYIHQLIIFRELPAANTSKEGHGDEIAENLKANLRPGDSIQLLDWAGGAVHAMLMARVKLAAPFVYDESFYHNLDIPYVQQLRTQFVGDLERIRPRFIIEVHDDGPYSEPTGPNTSREFPELRSFLTGHYAVIQEGQGYRIHEIMGKQTGV